ncbi:unnamed protein product [Urochloa humidicola]
MRQARSQIIRACLEWSISKGISKDWRTYVLLTSCAVWNKGIEIPVPVERIPSLSKTQGFLHPLGAKVFLLARLREHERENARAKVWLWSKKLTSGLPSSGRRQLGAGARRCWCSTLPACFPCRAVA